MSEEYIVVKGAREHNLKGINLRIPRNKLVVITGLSGSGKSSLAFDTLYAEGQRRYVESLSTYARQFLGELQKPDVEHIKGLPPAVAIEQRKAGLNPRSTVGTQTEIYDYLRLLFARIGMPHCYKCGEEVRPQSAEAIVGRILALPPDTNITVLAPLVRGRKGEYHELLGQARKQGFVRVRADGAIFDLSDRIDLDKNRIHNIEVVVDRLILKGDIKKRLTDSVETALKAGKGIALISYESGKKKEDIIFSELFACVQCGISLAELEPRIFSFNSPYGACPACHGLGVQDIFRPELTCSACNGARLKKESLSVTIDHKSIRDVTRMSVKEAQAFFDNLSLKGEQAIIARQVLKGIRERLKFMAYVGLDYLALDRRSDTLSSGEAQRVRLATQVGTGLVGVVYILDEPSIGLHQRDNARLLNILKALKDLGNTLIVVEHDEATIKSADYLIDLGPGAGKHGGTVVAEGGLKEILNCEHSLTGKYLKGKLKIEAPAKTRDYKKRKSLEIKGAREHNLKNIDVRIPLGVFTCITGVSGAGKSTLIDEILYRSLLQALYKSKVKPGAHDSIEGVEHIDKVIVVDQSPIGRTSRSNPATYSGVFTHIRELFSKIPEAKVRGYHLGRFSFNVKGGRCENCRGEGVKTIEMHFLPDIYTKCEVCKGKRFNEGTLEVRYKGRSIADVLAMTVEEAMALFKNIPVVMHKLKTLFDVGLGYIELGQLATTLSGGEAQSVKLAKELSKRQTGRTLYILDEPTTGLHFADIHKLLEVLQALVNTGNTVLVIEHNLEVIKTADYIVDLGPEGGDRGGEVVSCGTPREIMRARRSHTGFYLKKLKAGPHRMNLSTSEA